MTRVIPWLSLTLLVGAGACVQVLGNDFTVDEGNGGSTSSSGGGTGGTGGTGGVGMGGSMGGGGNEGGSGPCILGTSQGCPAGEKCTAVDPMDLSLTTCVQAGNGGPTALCTEDTECTTGTYCDPFTGICEAICENPGTQSTCGLGWCQGNMQATHGLCTVGCDPTAPQGCPDPTLICGWWGPTENEESTFHCAQNPDGAGITKNVGESCTLIPNVPILHSCGPGLVCVDDLQGNGFCRQWCEPVGVSGPCMGVQNCVAFPIPVIQAGVEYGICL